MVQVQSQVKELRSHKLHSAAKTEKTAQKKKKKKKKEIKFEIV